MRVTKTRTFAFGMSLALTLGAICPPQGGHSAEVQMKKVMVGYPSFSPFALWYLLGKELGFYRQEGLEPEFVLVRGGGIAVKGLLAGNFDYIIPTGPVADAIIRTNYPFKIVLTTSLVHFWLVAQAEIWSVSELKGKTIAILTPGSTADITLRETLRQEGLNPFKDAIFLSVGSSQDRFTALTSGAVHATILSPPFDLKAVKMGYRKLASVSDYVKWPAGGLSTTEEKIRRDAPEVGKMVRASLKGLKFTLTQKEYVVAKRVHMFRLTKEEALQTYDGLEETFVPSGYFSAETERKVIAMMRQAANITEEIPPERVFDNRFVKQVEQELRNWTPQIPR